MKDKICKYLDPSGPTPSHSQPTMAGSWCLPGWFHVFIPPAPKQTGKIKTQRWDGCVARHGPHLMKAKLDTKTRMDSPHEGWPISNNRHRRAGCLMDGRTAGRRGKDHAPAAPLLAQWRGVVGSFAACKLAMPAPHRHLTFEKTCGNFWLLTDHLVTDLIYLYIPLNI